MLSQVLHAWSFSGSLVEPSLKQHYLYDQIIVLSEYSIHQGAMEKKGGEFGYKHTS